MMVAPEKAARYRARIVASTAQDSNHCWIWQKTRSSNGYGTFAFGGGRNARAHRVSFECFRGPIPDGMDVCHRCDVRACVNPAHLFVGTRAENIRDAVIKGRVNKDTRARGIAHPSAKLTEDAVTAILEDLAQGVSKRQLALSYGVSQRTVLLIARGETWAHIRRPS